MMTQVFFFFFLQWQKKGLLYNRGSFYYSHHVNHSLTQPNCAERMRKTQKPEELILLFAPDAVCRATVCLEELPARFVLQRKQNGTSQTEGYLKPIRPDTKQNGYSTVGSFTVKHRPSDVSWSSTRAKNNIFLTPPSLPPLKQQKDQQHRAPGCWSLFTYSSLCCRLV